MTKDTNTINIFEPVRNEDIKAIKTYIKNGGDVNARDNDGDTALILATLRNAPEIVKLLINKGANVNIKGIGGETALILAADEGHLEVVKHLIGRGAPVDHQDDVVSQNDK